MKEIIWLGRGGQGAFTAAKLLGAAFTVSDDNRYALAFPSFGPERRGAPVRAYTKLDSAPVNDRSQTEKADVIAVLDDSLFSPELAGLLKENGKLIVNSKTPINGAETVDAQVIAEKFRLPTVNTVMLGIIAGSTGIVSVDAAAEAVSEYMPAKIRERNISALREAAEEVAV